MSVTSSLIFSEPAQEIHRDSHVRELTARFGTECKHIMLVGLSQTGKTTLLAQFELEHQDFVVSYYLSENPQDQRKHTFLYSICSQLRTLLGNEVPPEDISTEDLETLYFSLATALAQEAKRSSQHYYYVIDGLEWSLKGAEGDRIIDFLPPHSTREGPFLLSSCRQSHVDSLPNHLRSCHIEHPRAFSKHETRAYLAPIVVSNNELEIIQRNTGGSPGYLKVLRAIKLANPSTNLATSLPQLEELLNQQVEQVFYSSEQSVTEALELLGVSPASLPLPLLSSITTLSESTLAEALETTSLVTIRSNIVEYVNDLTREAVSQRLEPRKQTLLQQLVDAVRAAKNPDSFLLSLLLRELQDYNGIQALLAPKEVVYTVKQTRDISQIVKTMLSAAELAKQYHDTAGLLKWSLGIGATRAFVSHAVNQDEIEALLAVGALDKALERAYKLPEDTSKIRFLARAYTIMRSQGHSLTKKSVQELDTYVTNIDLESADRELIRQIAIDIFPILPDRGMELLEVSSSSQGSVRNLIDAVVVAAAKEALEDRESSNSADIKDQATLTRYVQYYSDWLRDFPFSSLQDEVDTVESTNAKEYLIRQWCHQNKTSSQLTQAINFWLDIVVADESFTIPLRSLRRMSDYLTRVPVEERLSLINRLKVPLYVSIKSPYEEWIRFRLNLAESLVEVDQPTAILDAYKVYRDTEEFVLDLDARTYCLARLRITANKLLNHDLVFKQKITDQFESCFRQLISESADHFEVLRGTIRTLVDVDLEEALITANELNTRDRRFRALRIVLIDSLRKHSKQDISKLIDEALSEIEDERRDSTLADIVSELAIRGTEVAEQNLLVLAEYVYEVDDPYFRAYSLAHLAVLFHVANIAQAPQLAQDAKDAWKQENDLKLRMHLGYMMVERLARFDLELARDLLSEVEQLYTQLGASLAAGELGSFFVKLIELAIRSMTQDDFDERKPVVQYLHGLIKLIPAIRMKVHLYALLASAAYRSERSQFAAKVVEQHILPAIEMLPSLTSQRLVIEKSLPIIFQYHPDTAINLAKQLFRDGRNRAWYRTILWLFTDGFLSDISLDASKLRREKRYPIFTQALSILEFIDADAIFYNAIQAVTSAIEVSCVSRHVEKLQAYDLLQKLDMLVDKKLPDLQNITHDGYLVIAKSAIHRARSKVLQKLGRSGTLDKEDITKGWRNLFAEANDIPNVADRCFVLSLLVQDAAQYYNGAPWIKKYLQEAREAMELIPTLRDKHDRLESLAKSYKSVGEKTVAAQLMRLLIEEVGQLKNLDAEHWLTMLVQSAHSIDKQLAEEVAAQFDRRSSRPFLNPAELLIEVERLVEDPARLLIGDIAEGSDFIVKQAAIKLRSNLVSGITTIPTAETLTNWASLISSSSPDTALAVAEWVLEGFRRKYSESLSGTGITPLALLDTAELVAELAAYSISTLRAGFPDSIKLSFPGLNRNVITFQPDEVERAKNWLEQWLQANAKEYLKICDPYFEADFIGYLRYIPSTCRVLIVATDDKLKGSQAELLQQFQQEWEWRTTQKLPSTSIIVVPKKAEDRFHDRAIVTKEAGLNLGPSLNGIGKSWGNITVLSKEDARDLEEGYIDTMLNYSSWFTQHDLTPIVLQLGKS